MSLGTVLGEFIGKVTSVGITSLGGGDQCIENDFTGEAKGQVPGPQLGMIDHSGQSAMHVAPLRPRSGAGDRGDE